MPTIDYAELHCRTNFSFLSAASHLEVLVRRAMSRATVPLAITDECSLAGVVRPMPRRKLRSAVDRRIRDSADGWVAAGTAGYQPVRIRRSLPADYAGPAARR